MRTRSSHLVIAFLLVACIVPPARAADLAAGLDALDRDDYAAALREFTPLADDGNARAQYRLGTMYAMGLGVPRDFAQAASWLKKAAQQGD